MQDRRETVDLLRPAEIEHRGGDHEQHNPKEQHQAVSVNNFETPGFRV
jgi:hypothetical protein